MQWALRMSRCLFSAGEGRTLTPSSVPRKRFDRLESSAPTRQWRPTMRQLACCWWPHQRVDPAARQPLSKRRLTQPIIVNQPPACLHALIWCGCGQSTWTSGEQVQTRRLAAWAGGTACVRAIRTRARSSSSSTRTVLGLTFCMTRATCRDVPKMKTRGKGFDGSWLP